MPHGKAGPELIRPVLRCGFCYIYIRSTTHPDLQVRPGLITIRLRNSDRVWLSSRFALQTGSD